MDRLAKVFKALSDESRLRILSLLFTSGELCVCDIEDVMKCTQTKVSRHLAYLRKAGLVADRRQGLWMLYSIARPKNEDDREILGLLAEMLKTNGMARQDVRRLAGSIRKGCCATVSLVKTKCAVPAPEIHKT